MVEVAVRPSPSISSSDSVFENLKSFLMELFLSAQFRGEASILLPDWSDSISIGMIHF